MLKVVVLLLVGFKLFIENICGLYIGRDFWEEEDLVVNFKVFVYVGFLWVNKLFIVWR